jgi:hypothetical protein
MHFNHHNSRAARTAYDFDISCQQLDTLFTEEEDFCE